MIQQGHPNLKFAIRKSGCYFLSLLGIVQVESKRGLTVDDINSLYDQAVDNKYMDSNCEIIKPDSILKIGFRLLGIRKTFYQIGVMDISTSKRTFWGWVKDKSWDWIIVEFKTTSKYGTHFTLRDKSNIDFYDPLNGSGYSPTGITKLVYYKDFS